MGLETAVGIAVKGPRLHRLVDIALHPGQDGVVIGVIQGIQELVPLLHLSQGPGGHQGDLVPGNGFFWTEIVVVIILRHHHAGDQRGVHPATLCQPVVRHIFHGCLGLAGPFHPSHGFTVGGQMNGIQKQFGKLCPGNGLFWLKGPAGVAIDPPSVHGPLDLFLCPVALNIRRDCGSPFRRRS